MPKNHDIYISYHVHGVFDWSKVQNDCDGRGVVYFIVTLHKMAVNAGAHAKPLGVRDTQRPEIKGGGVCLFLGEQC